MKILCLLLPHFPSMCEALRKPAVKDRAVIVTHSSGSQKLVLDYSQRLDGLQSDMPLQQALARYGEAELLSADMPYYRSVFAELLDALEGVSPLVEGAELGRVFMNVDGLQLIYPDDDAIIDTVFHVVPESFVPQAGMAGNKFLAYLTARCCPPGGRQVLTGEVADFLRDLTCDVLPVSMKSKEKLRRFGLHTLGQIADLPKGPLLSQFGSEGKRIHEFARGYDDTPLYPRMMEQAIEESTTLASVTVSLESILVSLEELLGKVFARISCVGLGVRSLTVWTRTWNAEQWERTVRFKEPAMDIKTVINRIKRVMEEYPQPGPVEQIGLNISRLGYPGGRQNSLFREIRSQNHLMEDIRQLELRLGNPQVYRVKEVEPWSRIPERRYVLAPTNR
ncbi:MAG: DNA polymerase Y family protein [Planctomycetota bacterium]|jgi:DNA polymerase-4/protein ImuB